MKKLELKCWAIFLIFLFSILLISGCGPTKKTKKTSEKEEIKTEQVETSETTGKVEETKTDTKTDSESNTKVEETTKEVIYTPVDPDKPMNHNGKEYHNTQITEREQTKKGETKTQTSQTESSTKAVSEAKENTSKSDIKETKTETEENYHKETKSVWYIKLWWLWIILLAALIYYIRKKVKQGKSLFSFWT